MRSMFIGIAFLVAILLVSGCLQTPDKGPPSTSGSSDKFRATVNVSNTAPAAGESVSFSYSVVYEGNPVKVVIVQKKSWRDSSGNFFERKVSELEKGSTSFGVQTKTFNEEGQYTYELGIFDCKEVEAKLKTTCENADSENIFSSVKPVELVKRIVNVGGEPDTTVTPPPSPQNGEVEDCGDSQICLSEGIENCSPTTATIKIFEETKITVQGMENGKCKIHYETIRSPNPALEGLDYTCLVPEDRLSDYEQFLAESLTTACTGPYWDYFANPPQGQGEEENQGTDDPNYLSEQSCESNRDCPEDFPACFLDTYCVKPNQYLSEYISQNYEQGNCASIVCENCKSGTLVTSAMGYQVDEYDFEETFCIECSSNNFFKCKTGYECSLGKCVAQ